MFTKTNTNISILNLSVQECLILYKDNIDYTLQQVYWVCSVIICLMHRTNFIQQQEIHILIFSACLYSCVWKWDTRIMHELHCMQTFSAYNATISCTNCHGYSQCISKEALFLKLNSRLIYLDKQAGGHFLFKHIQKWHRLFPQSTISNMNAIHQKQLQISHK